MAQACSDLIPREIQNNAVCRGRRGIRRFWFRRWLACANWRSFGSGGTRGFRLRFCSHCCFLPGCS